MRLHPHLRVGAALSALFADLFKRVGHALLDFFNNLLLLLHAGVGLIDAFVERVVLIKCEVTSLALGLDHLLLVFFRLASIVQVQTHKSILSLLAFNSLLDKSRDVLGLSFLPDL